jgi:cobalt-zinc-cadmium efflux system membrane fusion protein
MKANLIFLLFWSFIIASCNNSQKNGSSNLLADKDKAYLIDTITFASMNEELQLNGYIDFDQDKIVKVFSLVTGRVNKVNVDLGTLVKKGDVLAELNSPDILNLKRDYEQDKSDVELAERNYKNVKDLYAAKFSSETDLITAKTQFEKAKEELLKSTQVLKLYEGYKQSKNDLLQVNAPIEGYVVEKNVNSGVDIRNDNMNPLFTISDLKTVWVMANVYEQDINKVKLGEQVDVHVLAYPSVVFKGTISNVSSVIDKDSKVLKARIEILNSDGKLKPDMYASIFIKQLTDKKALRVKPKAIVFDNNNYFVVVKSGENFRIEKVEIVLNTSQYTYIKGNIKEGEIVVTEGSLLLFNSINS